MPPMVKWPDGAGIRRICPVLSRTGAGHGDAGMVASEPKAEEKFERVDLVTAARRMGLGVDTVRKRLGRGQLRGEKVEGRWQVFVEPEDTGRSRNEPDTGRTDVLELLASERRRADELAGVVEVLRQQLEARNKAEEELRVLLLRQSEQLARLLPAPAEPQVPTEETAAATSTRKRHWWQIWSRSTIA